MTLPCRQFEERCQEWLDAPRAASGWTLRQALEEHAAHCPSCRQTWTRFRTLERALRSWSPPAPPEDFTTRVLAAHASRPVRPRLLPGPWHRRAAVAAALLVLATAALLPSWNRRPGPPPIPPHRQVEREPVRPLQNALADATAAALGLARAASEPAARLGRQLLTAAELPEPPLRLPSVHPEPPAETLDAGGVTRGVEALTGTARHAFQFLLGPTQRPAPPDRGA